MNRLDAMQIFVRVDLIRAGFGIAQIPRVGAEDYLAQGKLVEVLKNSVDKQ